MSTDKTDEKSANGRSSSPEKTRKKEKQKQMSLEFFASPMRRKRVKADKSDGNGVKRTKICAEEDHMATGIVETEDMVDQEILDLATGSSDVENDATDMVEEHPTSEQENAISGRTKEEGLAKPKLSPEERKLQREKEREEKKKKREIEEERKREIKRLKKLEEDERRRLKKEKEEEEKRLKREQIEAERKLKLEQKEREKQTKQKKREEEIRLREEKKNKEEEEKLKRREELEKKRMEKLLEKQKIEQEKERKRLEEENKKQKRSITNFFKVKPTTTVDSSHVASGQIPSDKTSATSVPQQVTAEKSEFQQYFLSFHIKPNVQLANNKKEISDKWDQFITDPKSATSVGTETKSQNEAALKTVHIEHAIDVLQCLNAGSINEANNIFRNVPLKYLKFYENKKSAYLGTFSYTTSDIKDKTVNLRLHPCAKVEIEPVQKNDMVDITRKVIDYEYDSDADFEGDEDEEGEGEDLNSADEEDDNEDDDMGSSDIDDGFVESDVVNGSGGSSGASQMKKRTIGPLVPLIRHCNQTIAEGDEFGELFISLRWERLHENIEFPIDPFKNYWTTDAKKPDFKSASCSAKEPGSVSTTPERTGDVGIPNNILQPTILASNSTNIITATAADPAKTATPSKIGDILTPTLAVKKKIITNQTDVQVLLEFVKAHSTFSLNTMAELAMKDSNCQNALEKYSRAVVKNTVREYASFDKKNGWRCTNELIKQS